MPFGVGVGTAGYVTGNTPVEPRVFIKPPVQKDSNAPQTTPGYTGGGYVPGSGGDTTVGYTPTPTGDVGGNGNDTTGANVDKTSLGDINAGIASAAAAIAGKGGGAFGALTGELGAALAGAVPIIAAKYQNAAVIDTLSSTYLGFTPNILDTLAPLAIEAKFQSVLQDWQTQKTMDDAERSAALSNALQTAAGLLFFFIPR
jgi:hypothetical protein